MKKGYKQCKACEKSKLITDFGVSHISKYTGKDIIHPRCKICLKEYRQEWYANNRDWYREKQNKYYKQIYYPANREKLVQKSVIHNKKRYDNDLNFRISHHISSRIREQLGKLKKNTRSKYLINFSIEELILHLENQFVKGMSWTNYGKEWHIDHIRPISSFNIESIGDPDFNICWNIDNLQPLWAFDNISKGDKYKGELNG